MDPFLRPCMNVSTLDCMHVAYVRMMHASMHSCGPNRPHIIYNGCAYTSGKCESQLMLPSWTTVPKLAHAAVPSMTSASYSIGCSCLQKVWIATYYQLGHHEIDRYPVKQGLQANMTLKTQATRLNVAMLSSIMYVRSCSHKLCSALIMTSHHQFHPPQGAQDGQLWEGLNVPQLPGCWKIIKK